MDINLIQGSNQIPHPRQDIRLLGVTLVPDAETRRVRVTINITPFAPLDRPSLEITVTNKIRQEVASMSIIETMSPELSVTTHLKEAEIVSSLYTFRVDLYFDPDDIQDSSLQTIDISTGDIVPEPDA